MKTRVSLKHFVSYCGLSDFRVLVVTAPEIITYRKYKIRNSRLIGVSQIFILGPLLSLIYTFATYSFS